MEFIVHEFSDHALEHHVKETETIQETMFASIQQGTNRTVPRRASRVMLPCFGKFLNLIRIAAKISALCRRNSSGGRNEAADELFHTSMLSIVWLCPLSEIPYFIIFRTCMHEYRQSCWDTYTLLF